MVVAAIGEDMIHEGIKGVGNAQEGAETVVALNARGMQRWYERASVRVDEGMALAAIFSLASVPCGPLA